MTQANQFEWKRERERNAEMVLEAMIAMLDPHYYQPIKSPPKVATNFFTRICPLPLLP